VSAGDKTRWEARYREDARDAVVPDPLLSEALAFAPDRGRALDLACGRGRHAIALAKAGYDVEAIDISPSALASARERARGIEILWHAADLDELALDRGVYAVIACIDFSDPVVAARAVEALAPDGILVFATVPRSASRFSPAPGEAPGWFGGLETVLSRESGTRIEYVGRKP